MRSLVVAFIGKTVATAVGLLLLSADVAWTQNYGIVGAEQYFSLEWEVGHGRGRTVAAGYVTNTYGYSAGNVRLQVLGRSRLGCGPPSRCRCHQARSPTGSRCSHSTGFADESDVADIARHPLGPPRRSAEWPPHPTQASHATAPSNIVNFWIPSDTEELAPVLR